MASVGFCKLFQGAIHFFAGRLNDRHNGEPNGEISDGENSGKDHDDHRFKRNPSVEKITTDVCEIKRCEMTKQRFCERPFLDLVENACAGMNEREQINGNDGDQNLRAAQGKIRNRQRQDKINDTENDGTEATEHQSSV